MDKTSKGDGNREGGRRYNRAGRYLRSRRRRARLGDAGRREDFDAGGPRPPAGAGERRQAPDHGDDDEPLGA